MFTNTTFQFDNRKSTDFGLYIVNLDTSTKNAPYAVEREINEEKVRNNPIPFFFGLNEQPLYFKVTLFREEEWDYDTRIEITRWLFQDEYKPFISTDHNDIIYNCIITDRPEKLLVGNIPRLIELTFRCDAPWAWSPFFSINYNLSDNITTQTITMVNKSNIIKYYYPEIWIQSLDGGTISLQNYSDSGREFKFNNLQANEIIYVNNQLKQIETDIPNIYRLKDFNRNWLRLNYGINQIAVTGKCLIKTQMQYPIAI